jgi:heptaprenylglyceryl phosphate synthase
MTLAIRALGNRVGTADVMVGSRIGTSGSQVPFRTTSNRFTVVFILIDPNNEGILYGVDGMMIPSVLPNTSIDDLG